MCSSIEKNHRFSSVIFFETSNPANGMDSSDFIELGAGLALGAQMTHRLGGVLNDAIDSRSATAVITVPQTRAEIQSLLDLLDVRLANGGISEATYKTLVAKWESRLANAP
jgi:hypothetical protein